MSDLDLPLLPSAEQIRRRKFATVKRGYDPDQVHEYLNQVAIQVETLETDLRDERMGASSRAGETVAAAPPKAAPAPPAAAASTEAAYEQLSKRFATVLKAADAESQALIEKARAESTKLLGDARIEADKIRVDAQANAEESRTKSAAELERAREEADRVLGGLEARREAMLTQMHDMQSRLINVAKELEVPDEGPAAPGAHAATPAQATPAPGPKPNHPVAVTPPPPKAPTDAGSRPDAISGAGAGVRRRGDARADRAGDRGRRGSRRPAVRGSVGLDRGPFRRHPGPERARYRLRRRAGVTRKAGPAGTASLARFASLSPDGPVVPALALRESDEMAQVNERLDGIEAAYDEVAAQLATPETIADPDLLRTLGKRYAELEVIVTPYRELRAALATARTPSPPTPPRWSTTRSAAGAVARRRRSTRTPGGTRRGPRRAAAPALGGP